MIAGTAAMAAAPTALHASPFGPAHADAAADADADGDERAQFSEFGALAMNATAMDLSADPEWDTTWTKKITGKHRAMFDAPEVSEGAGVFRAGVWAKQYTDVFKMPASDLSAVIVLRHNGIILAMNQAFWDEYNVGKRNNVRDGKGKKTNKNPALAAPPEPGKQPKPFDAYMLEQQMARGVIVLACNMAFASAVYDVSKQDKLKMPEARAKALSMLVPGVILQPSGIFANVLAQQNGCSFVAAS